MTLYVRDCDHPTRHTAACYTTRVLPEDLIAAVRNLDGAEVSFLDSAEVVSDDLIEVTMYLSRDNGGEMFRKGGDVLIVAAGQRPI